MLESDEVRTDSGGDRRCESSFTGVGTALITPFTRAARWTKPRSGGWRGGRSTPACTSWCRAAPPARRRRSSPAERRRIVEICRRRGDGPRAGAGRRGRLRHARSHPRRRGDAEGRRARPAVGDAVLQQADARRACTSTTRRSPTARRCRSSSTTCPAAPAATSIRRRSSRLATIPNIVGVKEASGNMTQMAEICRARAARTSSCCRETTR